MNLDEYNTQLRNDINHFRQEIDTMPVAQYEHLSAEIATVQELSENGTDYIKVAGIALSEGAHKDGIYYTASELQAAAPKLVGVEIYYDFTTAGAKHNPIPDHKVGKITHAFYDKDAKAIRYEAIITNKSVAQEVVSGAIHSVSVGVGSFKKFVENIKYGVGLFFKELSLVMRGADKKASVSPLPN